MEYLFLTIAVIAVCAMLYMKNKGIKKAFTVVFAICAVSIIAYVICVLAGEKPEDIARYVAKTQLGALGYGIGATIKEKAPDAKKVVFFTYGSEKRTSEITDAFKAAFPDTEFETNFVCKSDPGMMINPSSAIRAFQKALSETSADVAVIEMGLKIDPALVKDFKGKLLIISFDEAVDEKVAKSSNFLGRIKQNPKFIPEGISSNPQKAFAENYEIID